MTTPIFTMAEADIIRQQFRTEGLTIQEMADRWSVSASTIWWIVNGGYNTYRKEDAPPAQKIIEGLQDALAHTKGEAPARYNCGHWHGSPADAANCPKLRQILGEADSTEGGDAADHA